MKKLTTENFIKKTKKIHNNHYDYSLSIYTGSKNKIKIICNKHGIFEQTPNDHLSGKGCSKCHFEKLSSIFKRSRQEFIEKSKQIHYNKYDYSKFNYVNANTKGIIICKIHGEFEQIPNAHLHMRAGCFKCYGTYSNKNIFIKKAINRHGELYDYSKVDYINNKTKIKILCQKHGLFTQTPNSHLFGQGCPKCRESKGEKLIRKWLIENQILFISQHKFLECNNIKLLPFDFYLPDYNSCIEYDGEQHHIKYDKGIYSGKLEIILKRDFIKTNFCLLNNIKLIRIPYTEILNIDKILRENLCC